MTEQRRAFVVPMSCQGVWHLVIDSYARTILKAPAGIFLERFGSFSNCFPTQKLRFQTNSVYEFVIKTDKAPTCPSSFAHRRNLSLVFAPVSAVPSTRKSFPVTVTFRGHARRATNGFRRRHSSTHARACSAHLHLPPPPQTTWPPWRAPPASPRSTPSSSTASPPRRSYCASHTPSLSLGNAPVAHGPAISRR